MIWQILAALLLRIRYAYWWVIYRAYRSRYCIDPTFRFNGTGVQLYGPGHIDLGAGSYVGEFCSIQGAANRRVVVGKSCMISHNVRIYSETALADCDFISGPVEHRAGDVCIEDGAWIGVNCYIGPGVTIGRNAVVGANAVVVTSVPPNEIWGGTPARRIRVKSERQS